VPNVAYEPIKCVRTLSGLGFPSMERVGEVAAQTFVLGAPLVLNAGNLQECTFGGAEIVYGVSAEPGHNLTTANTAEEGYSEGHPQNQSSGKIIPHGAWPKDGKVGVYRADAQNIFSIALKAGQVFTQAMIGTTYGIVKDASGYWYLDNTDVAGDNVVATVIGNDDSAPNTVAGGARVFFQFISTLRFFK
jgi:hypothetical protein